MPPSRAEHTAHDARLFVEPARAVVSESAERALARFDGYRLRELHDGFAS